MESRTPSRTQSDTRQHYSRWHDAVIRVYDAARNVIETHEHKGEVTGHCELHVPGRIVLALFRRRLRDGTLTSEAAIKFALEIGLTGLLTDEERYQADRLDGSADSNGGLTMRCSERI